MSREIQPDGQKINRLREERGWQAQDLADKAQCSLRTVTNLEAGKRCFKCTLAAVASALGVEYRELLAGAEPPPPPPPREVRITVQITISRPSGEFDETDELLAWVKNLSDKLQDLRHSPLEDMEVQKVEKGSVVITLELNAEELGRLMRYLARESMSNDLGIQAIKVPDGVKLPVLDDRGAAMPPWPSRRLPGEKINPSPWNQE